MLSSWVSVAALDPMLARDHRLKSGSNVAIDGIARCIMYAQAIAKSLHDAAKVVLQQRWSEFF
jgi:hypothetical protein